MDPWPKHPRSPNEPGDPDEASTQVHRTEPDPEGLGFRTGMRSARTVLGFAWFVLVMGTLLLLMGAIIFIGQSAWIPFIILCLVELGFIAVFFVLVKLARRRRAQQD